MTSSSDRKDVRRNEKLADHRAAQDRETVVAICSTEAGRRWFWERLSEGHIFQTSYTPDALATAFAEGERNASLRLMSQLQTYCPEQFVVMMREANDRRSRDTDPGARRGNPDEPAVDDAE